MNRKPALAATQARGWPSAHKWLLARRASQLAILALFLAGPLAGLWIVKGTLASSLTLGVLPLTDPFLVLQSLFARHPVAGTALLGAAIVAAFYLLVGGRVYCAWVCPMNMVTDAAAWLRRRLGIRRSRQLSPQTRYWLAGALLLAAAATGTLAWELVNPVSMLHRGLVFGMGLGWLAVAGVFLFDLLYAERGWCGHVCPMGASYAALGFSALPRVTASGRERCDMCLDCFAVCPEPQVISPVLKRGATRGGPMIKSPNCTNCGRCIDVCSKDVFHFTIRLSDLIGGKHENHSPGGSGLPAAGSGGGVCR